MIVDSHAHLQIKEFWGSEYQEVVEQTAAAGLVVVNSGVSVKTSREAIELAERYPSFYATVGVAHRDAHAVSEGVVEKLRVMCEHPRVVALGEIGLDYYHMHHPPKVQMRGFVQQLKLAAEIGIPVVIHSREADRDVEAILDRYAVGKVDVVLHCFAGDERMLRWAMERGVYLSISGMITRNPRLEKVVSRAPLESILIETDSPFLTPKGLRGRNRPTNVIYVANHLAKLLGTAQDDVLETSSKNASRVFRALQPP